MARVGQAWFVDCHSHVCPSGDDGAQTLDDGAALCRSAGRHGTAILFATPHVWPHLPLTGEREAEVRETFALLTRRAVLELRLGWELTPARRLLDDDLRRNALEGTDRILVEVPFTGEIDLLLRIGERAEAAGLTPVVAHPERTEAVLDDPVVADELAARGWPLQVNASSLLGRHGDEPERVAWDLVERGLAAIVASDGHRTTRPAHLDEAYAAVVRTVGVERAEPLFDGTALGIDGASRRPTASRAASRGA